MSSIRHAARSTARPTARRFAALAAAAMFGTGAAFAQAGQAPDDLQNVAPAASASNLSRDEVRLELQFLQQHGLYQPGGEASPGPLEAQHQSEALAELLGQDQQVAMNGMGDTVIVFPDRSMAVIEVVPPDEANPGEAIPEEVPIR